MTEMAGYDKEAALAFILSMIDMKAYKSLANEAPRLISRMIAADIAYMHMSGALDETGDTGEGDYDEDDAFEYILELLVIEERADDRKEQALAALLNDYFQVQSLFMERSGLVMTDQT